MKYTNGFKSDVNYLPNNRSHTELDNPNWDVMEISKIDDEIIKKILDKLCSGISDDFFLCFESLIKIGDKAKSVIISFIQYNEVKPFIKDVLYLILNIIEKRQIDHALLLKLYHPDFVIRARTIMEIENSGKANYLKFMIPLIEDPDDSVRWALIKFLVSLKLINNPMVKDKLEDHLRDEKNPIIVKKIKEILSG